MAVSPARPVLTNVKVQAATSSDPVVAERDFATAAPGYLVALDDPPTPEPLVLLKRNEAASVAPDPGYACLYDLSVEVSVTEQGHAWRYSYPASAQRASEAARDSVQVSSGSGMAFSAGDLVFRVYWGTDSDRMQVEFPKWDGRGHYGEVYGSPGFADLVSGLDGAPRRFSVSGSVEFYPTPGSAVAEMVGTVTVSGVAAAGRLSDAGSAWDVLYSPRTGLRKIVYAGDRAVFSAPASGDSLRGEALAYLVSGFRRVARVASGLYDGVLPWVSSGGAVSAVVGFRGLRFATGPELDLFRLRLLGYALSVRAPEPPLSGPQGGWVPAVVRNGGHGVSGGVRTDVGSDFPGWGDAWAVCGTQASVDANGGDWLELSGSGASAFPSADPEAEAFLLFAALNSPSQSRPCPLAGGPFASGYVPPSGQVPASESGPEPLHAADVAGLFARPAGDPAAATRAWLEGCVQSSTTSVGVVSPSCTPSFVFTAAAERTPSYWDAAEVSAAWAGWVDGTLGRLDPVLNPEAFSFAVVDGEGAESGTTATDVFDRGVWPSLHPNGYDVPYVSPERAASAVTTTSGTSPAAGSLWLLAAHSTDADDYVPYEMLGAPANYRKSSAPPYYEPSGTSPDGLFDIPYAGSSSDPDPSRPPAFLGDVPSVAPDDAAVLPLYVAEVERWWDECDDGASAPDGPDGPTHTRATRWTVCGPAPTFGRWTRPSGGAASFAGDSPTVLPATPAGLAAFAETVFALADPDAPAGLASSPQDLLSGTSRVSFEATGRTFVVRDTRDNHVVVSYPEMAWSRSGDAVVKASVRVSVSFGPGLFESGYCA